MATAADVMKRDLITVRAESPIREVLQLLMAHRISGLPVVDGAGRLAGVITEKDVMRLLAMERGSVSTVAELMTRQVRAFQHDAPLEEVCDCLMANHFRRVPILDGERLVGLISRADLMPTILALLD